MKLTDRLNDLARSARGHIGLTASAFLPERYGEGLLERFPFLQDHYTMYINQYERGDYHAISIGLEILAVLAVTKVNPLAGGLLLADTYLRVMGSWSEKKWGLIPLTVIDYVLHDLPNDAARSKHFLEKFAKKVSSTWDDYKSIREQAMLFVLSTLPFSGSLERFDRVADLYERHEYSQGNFHVLNYILELGIGASLAFIGYEMGVGLMIDVMGRTFTHTVTNKPMGVLEYAVAAPYMLGREVIKLFDNSSSSH